MSNPATTPELEYLATCYQVPATIGQPITYKGRPGKIVGAHGMYLKLQFDGQAQPDAGNYHPTWEMTYPDALQVAHTRLRARMKECAEAFHEERDGELSDMKKPAFWDAITRLAVFAEPTEITPDDGVLKTVREASSALGSPGDFGYGTKPGDALQALYYAYNDCCKIKRERQAAALAPAMATA